MSPLPTYPGVYIQEIPSGVRTITGVSTSVTAFVGKAKSGPVNQAVHLLSFSDFEREFGGLDEASEMSFAVRQFFLNGGTEAWAVRLAKDAGAAGADLSGDLIGQKALAVSALDEGRTGGQIDLAVTRDPINTFTLLVRYRPEGDPSGLRIEEYVALSMNPKDPRYVEDAINGVSKLIRVEVPRDLAAAVPDTNKGTSTSGALDVTDLAKLVDEQHKEFRVAVNGLQPVSVTLQPDQDLKGGNLADQLITLCKAIEDKVQKQANGRNALRSFGCASPQATNTIKMTSGEGGLRSSIRVLPGALNDVSARLKLGSANGGLELDAASSVRPIEVPARGTLQSPDLSGDDLTGIDAKHDTFRLILNNGLPVDVSIDQSKIPRQAGPLKQDDLAPLAAEIEFKVQGKRPNDLAFTRFTCRAIGTRLALTSGTAGEGSSVRVEGAPTNSLSDELKLTRGTGATQVDGQKYSLQGLTESDFGPEDEYEIYIGSREKREGIFALEAVDLFNILCLPGVSEAGALADAMSYCQERRAFFIVDPPSDQNKPADMVAFGGGPTLPKIDYGAVYYPWIKIPNPLKGGKLRLCPPSGTMAGVMARTDGTRGVWKAPAGTEATLNGVQALSYTLTDPENGTLNPHGVNCLRMFPVFGPVAWGARTLRGDNQMASEWKYIPVRRLALYLEESLYRGTKWVVFESNDEPLWSQIRLNIGAFMHTLFRQGAFQGQTPKDAYLVKCDKETTTQDDINNGIVNILVGFAPLKPAEFVYISIQQMAGQIQA